VAQRARPSAETLADIHRKAAAAGTTRLRLRQLAPRELDEVPGLSDVADMRARDIEKKGVVAGTVGRTAAYPRLALHENDARRDRRRPMQQIGGQHRTRESAADNRDCG